MSVRTECINRLKTIARSFLSIVCVLLAMVTFATERPLTLQEGVKTKSSIEVCNGASIGLQTYAVTVKVNEGRKARIHVKMLEDVSNYAGGGHTECVFPGYRTIYMSKESSYTSYSWDDFLYDHVYFNFFRTYYRDVTFKVGAYWSFGTGITQGLEIEVEYESAYFDVTFSNNGGDGYMPPQQLCEGVEAHLDANRLTRKGYAFKGWAKRFDAVEPDYPDGAKVTLWGATTLYAVWEKIYGDASDQQVDASQTVRVTFDPGRGTLEKNSRLYYRNAQYGDLPSPSISDIHYRFFGWERSAAGPLLLSTDRVNSDCTLQAHIERVKFDIRFDPCGGVVSPAVMTYDRNSTYGTAFPAVSRTGYSFTGWFSAEGDAGIAYRSSDRCLADGVMYAHWNPNRYDVVLSDNGGSGGSESVVGTYAAFLPSVIVPERDGYEFDGYWSAKEGGLQYVDGNGIGCRSFDFAEGGRTLYAHWNARAYSLTLEPSGGTGGSATGMARFGGKPYLVAVPQRAGYVFTGYYTAADGGTRYYDENGDGTAAYEQAKPATLYAHWAEEVAVTYHANWVNGDVDFGNLPRTFETFGVGLTYGTLPTPTRDGFVFEGWYSSPTGGARIDDNSVVTEDRQHLYAHWRALDNTIVVEKRADETSCRVSLWHASTYLAYISLSGYEWLSFSSLIVGSSIMVLSGSSRTFNNGWSGEGSLGLEMTANETGRTRYAYFPVRVGSSGGAIDYHVVIVQAGQWTMTLDGNGGTVSPTSLTVESGYPFGLLPEATRAGWSFDGWQTEGDEPRVVSDDSLVAAGTTRLVARWASVASRTLALDAAGGSGGSTSVSVVHGAYPADVTPPIRTGYAFAGYRAPNGVAYYDGKGKALRPWDLQDVDALYATWVPKMLTIVLDKGEGERLSISAAYGELMPTVDRPTRTDADFDGYWSESGVRYYSKTAQPERICDFETTATLYAKWRPVVKTSALYCVIDISAGADAKSYPVSYLDAPPTGGWTDRHKTDCIVLRRIDPGTFEMGLPKNWARSLSQVLAWGSLRHSVTITKPYYIGVFEVTQRQWELVMGTRPSYFENDSCYAKRPVESVSYNMIRASDMWPKYGYVGENGFLYRLRVRTGMGGLDLPTNAQWEMACRAGSSYEPPSGRNSGNSGASSDLCDVACTTAYGTAEVASYLPNAWGLYDMLGNVEEWCLDRGWPSSEDSQTDPVGLPYTDKDPSRCLRGGDFRAPTREAAYINETWYFTADERRGFRLALQTAQLADNPYPEVTVSFLSGDGKRIVSKATYQVGEAYGVLPNLPVRMGYVGEGWSATRNGGTIVRADELVTLTRTNLYACWKATIRTPPNAPIGLKAGCGASTEAIRLTWDPVDGADCYNIYRGSCSQADSAVKIATVSVNSYEDCETLSSGVDYFYWVESVNVIGRSEKGMCAIGWVAPKPPLMKVESVSAAGVSLAWENVSGCNCYRIYRAIAPDGVKVALGSDWQSERTFVDTTCEPGVEYLYYVVAAKNCFGDRPSDYSMAVRATRVAPMRVTVRYGANDGSSACQQMSQKAGMAGIEPQIPTRVGYDFLGWSRSPTAQAPEFPAGSAVVVSSDCDLYAVWREVVESQLVPFDYEVSFDSVWINCYTGTDTDVVIPSEIDGLPVVRIDGFRPEGAAAFNVKSVTLPDSLRGISEFAFYGCDKLTAIRIPASVSHVSEPYLAFYGCDALQSIEVDNGNSEYKSVNGCLLSKDGRTFLLAPPGRQKLEIPNGVKVLAANACSNQKVAFISIPEGVEELEFGVFAGALSLEQIEFPATVVKLGDSVFWKASSLKSVTFRGNAPVCGKDIYCDTPTELVTLVSFGSTGWAKSGSTVLPESWPVGDDHARAMRHGGSCPVVTNTITYLNLQGSANPNPATFTTNDLPLVLGPVERERWRFLGWTPNVGVIPAGTVTNVTFAAQWEEIGEPPPVEQPEEPEVNPWCEDADFSAVVANTYDGYMIDEGYNLLGIVQVKTTKQVVKKTTDRVTKAVTVTTNITATATVTDANGKKWSYSKGVVTVDGVVTGLKCTTKGCPVPEFGVKVGKNGMDGVWGEYAIFGARNGMGTKGDAMMAVLEAYKGKWSVTIGSAGETPPPQIVRLQLNVQAKGVVKIAGNWESGAKVSASAQLVMGDGFVYVPVMVKATKTSPALNALLRIDPEGGVALLSATDPARPESAPYQLVAGGRSVDELGEPVYCPSEVSAGGKAFLARVAVNELAYPAKFAAKKLPAGLKIDSAIGVISGTPIKPGHYVAEVTVTSGLNSRVKKTMTVEFDIANYTDGLIPVRDSYGPYYVGVSADERITAAAGCSVSGLPAGLKWTAKDIVDTKTKTTKTAANTVYGVPSKAGISTVYFKKTVKEPVNGRMKSVTHQASATFVVEGMQPWAIGTFDGGSSNGIVTLTVAKTGKISGKWMSGGLIWTLSAAAFDAYIPSKQMYVATVIGKSGKLVMTNEIEVTASGVVASSVRGEDAASTVWEAWRNGWKEEPQKSLAKDLKGKKVQVGEVLLTVGASGAVTAKGTFVTGFDVKKQKDITYSASCSTVLIPTEEADQYKVYLYFPPKAGKFDGFTDVVEIVLGERRVNP